jgi:hypothetical protein
MFFKENKCTKKCACRAAEIPCSVFCSNLGNCGNRRGNDTEERNEANRITEMRYMSEKNVIRSYQISRKEPKEGTDIDLNDDELISDNEEEDNDSTCSEINIMNAYNEDDEQHKNENVNDNNDEIIDF